MRGPFANCEAVSLFYLPARCGIQRHERSAVFHMLWSRMPRCAGRATRGAETIEFLDGSCRSGARLSVTLGSEAEYLLLTVDAIRDSIGPISRLLRRKACSFPLGHDGLSTATATEQSCSLVVQREIEAKPDRHYTKRSRNRKNRREISR